MKRILFLFSVSSLIFFFGCSGPKAPEAGNNIKSKISECFEKQEIDNWYPRTIDTTYGGYIERFRYDWTMDSIQDKYLVYETRHLWTTSQLARFFPDRPEFLRYAKQGFEFIKNKMWDNEEGGFYYAVDREGNPMPQFLPEKRIYGEGFAIYGLANYFLASGDSDALHLAQKTFNWLEKGAHDPQYGGYWEFLYRNGQPIRESDVVNDHFGDLRLKGLKDFNSSMHILEALTTLYEAWHDPVVKERLTEMLNILNKTMIDPKGYLVMYYYGNWQRVPGDVMNEKTGSHRWDHEPVTFGHDIELAYLLLEAAETLGWNDSTVMPTCIKLTEHTIKYGIDPVNGGIFNDGAHITADSMIITDRHKAWWAEFEALNSYLLMSQKVPAQRDRYYDLFVKQWDYIDKNLVDHKYGEIFNNGIDTDPRTVKMLKAHAWKAPYHTSRAFMNVIKNLDKEENMNM